MKILIGLLAATFLLVPTFSNAQSTSTLGPSCNSKKQKILPLHKIPQENMKSWCWAATAQNVMEFHDKKIDQCKVVANVYKYVDTEPCCGPTSTECWGQGGFPEWAFANFQFSFLHTWKTQRANKSNLTWEEATEEICRDRPFISSLDLTNGDRHSVVVTGYSVDRGVRIYDPLANDTTFYSSADFFDGESPLFTRVRDTYDIQPPK
jgi:hypothetical protein